MHNDNTQTTSHDTTGVSEAASNLADFWQYQLKRIKERAEDLKGRESHRLSLGC
jgi:hypothetical protein